MYDNRIGEGPEIDVNNGKTLADSGIDTAKNAYSKGKNAYNKGKNAYNKGKKLKDKIKKAKRASKPVKAARKTAKKTGKAIRKPITKSVKSGVKQGLKAGAKAAVKSGLKAGVNVGKAAFKASINGATGIGGAAGTGIGGAAGTAGATSVAGTAATAVGATATTAATGTTAAAGATAATATAAFPPALFVLIILIAVCLLYYLTKGIGSLLFDKAANADTITSGQEVPDELKNSGLINTFYASIDEIPSTLTIVIDMATPLIEAFNAEVEEIVNDKSDCDEVELLYLNPNYNNAKDIVEMYGLCLSKKTEEDIENMTIDELENYFSDHFPSLAQKDKINELVMAVVTANMLKMDVSFRTETRTRPKMVYEYEMNEDGTPKIDDNGTMTVINEYQDGEEEYEVTIKTVYVSNYDFDQYMATGNPDTQLTDIQKMELEFYRELLANDPVASARLNAVGIKGGQASFYLMLGESVQVTLDAEITGEITIRDTNIVQLIDAEHHIIQGVSLGETFFTVETDDGLKTMPVIVFDENDLGIQIVKAAEKHLHEIYSQTLRDNPSYSDCSSFVGEAYADAGHAIGGKSPSQITTAITRSTSHDLDDFDLIYSKRRSELPTNGIDTNILRPGDIICYALDPATNPESADPSHRATWWGNPEYICHLGIYAGNENLIHNAGRGNGQTANIEPINGFRKGKICRVYRLKILNKQP